MIQTALDFSSRPIAPASPTLPPLERQRLSNQNARILARLQQGPATNRELSEMALKYTGRLSELRQAGFAVTAEKRANGLTVYRLVTR